MNKCIDHGFVGDKDGYAKRRVGGKQIGIHRVVYCEYNDVSHKDIKGLVVRHTCDNSRCINPAHLVIGTVADNNLDAAVRRRHGKLKLTEAQVEEIRKFCRPSNPKDSAPNPYSYSSFARRFGVGHGAVRQAYLRESFTYLP